MNTIALENSPHLQRSRPRKSSKRMLCSFSGFWLILFAVVALASTARATIVGVTNCTCTNLTIQLIGFPDFPAGTLVAKVGGVVFEGTFDHAAQTMVLTRPDGLAVGSYLLEIFQDGGLFTSKEITVCACDCPCPGPRGPAGPAGLRGPAGRTGATGPPGPPSLLGKQGPAGPQGPKGDKGARGAMGPVGPTGATGATGPAGSNGVNGRDGTSGSSEYGYIYNLSAQVVPLETDVTFSDNGVRTAGITHDSGSSVIVILSAGDYKVTFSASGTEPNQFALFLNGAMVPGSAYGSGAGVQQNSGQAILTIGANDTLTLRNHTSSAAVTLAAAPPIGGTVAVVNASILLQKLN